MDEEDFFYNKKLKNFMILYVNDIFFSVNYVSFVRGHDFFTAMTLY